MIYSESKFYSTKAKFYQLPSGSLVIMVFALVMVGLAGCVGAVSPTKSPLAPSPAGLQITTTSLPAGVLGVNYSIALTATGGVPPYAWSITSGTLPTGVQLSTPSGIISGTPTVAGKFSLTAKALDAGSASSTVPLSLSIAASTVPTISNVSPNSGSSLGGTTVAISGSNFRAGDGVLFGSRAATSVQVLSSALIQTVTSADQGGTVSVSIQDSGGQTATAADAFTFIAPLKISTTSLPVGLAGASYSTRLAATGGVPPYTWSNPGSGLPTGLRLDPPTGTIAGTPILAGSFSFAAQVQDATSSYVATGYSLEISKKVSNSPLVVAITAPSSGAIVSKSVSVSASATDTQSSVLSVQFYLDGSHLGPALSSNPYAITWDTTQVADGNYNLSAVATDVAGATTTAAVDVTVKNTSTSWNPTVLGVPWANDFITIAANEVNAKTDPPLKVTAGGDGVADYTADTRAAIQLAASSGGGVVYFPAGDYKIIAPSNSIRGVPLLVPSHVILRGSGSATARIFVNDPQANTETDWTGTWGGIGFQGASLSGMTDLGVYAVNPSSSPCALLWNRGSAKASELFFNNLDVHLENCRNFWFESTDNLLVQGSNFDSNSSQYGPINVSANSHVSFLNNTITYHFGRVQLQNNTNLLMQGNKLIRDAQNRDMDNGTAIESGGVEVSFCQNVKLINNIIQTLNAPADEIGDGAAIMTQQSTVQNVLDAGRATAVTSTTLTDTDALWGPVTASRLAQYPEVVAILTGSATGEWRTIQGINTAAKTLTLSLPWNSVPEPGSLYSIFAWTLMSATIQGNTLTDNPNGIVLYDGCFDCTVQGNVLTNSKQIILRVVDQSLNPSQYPEGRRIHEVAINSRIVNNTVSNTSGIRPAYIVLDAEAFATTSYSGMGMMNIEVAGNTVEPFSANSNKIYNSKQNQIPQEGYFPCFLFGPAAIKDPVTTVFQKINFWNNSQSAHVTYSPNILPHATQACVTTSGPPAANLP